MDTDAKNQEYKRNERRGGKGESQIKQSTVVHVFPEVAPDDCDGPIPSDLTSLDLRVPMFSHL